jgi:hypothetical protein
MQVVLTTDAPNCAGLACSQVGWWAGGSNYDSSHLCCRCVWACGHGVAPTTDVPITALSPCVCTGGLVTSALVVTILGEGVLSEFDRLRSGAVPVAESGHSVLLGWSSRTLTVCRELAAAHEGERHVVVILSDRTKEAMEADVPRSIGRTSVVCRHGNAALLADLERVAVAHARHVVVTLTRQQHHDAQSSETLWESGNQPTVCVALRIRQAVTRSAAAADESRGLLDIDTAPCESSEGPSVVVEVHDRDVEGCVDMLNIPNCSTMLTSSFAGKLVINCAISPELYTVYAELISFRGVEIYVTSHANSTGRRFGDVAMACEGGTVIGVRHSHNKPRDGQRSSSSGGGGGGNIPYSVVLNPSDSLMICEHDDLVVMALDRSAYKFNFDLSPQHKRRLVSAGHAAGGHLTKRRRRRGGELPPQSFVAPFILFSRSLQNSHLSLFSLSLSTCKLLTPTLKFLHSFCTVI